MGTEEVRYISSSTVQPANHRETSPRQINLTPWDLKMLPFKYMQRGLLFSNHKLDEMDMISHLKASLSDTLDHFYPLAGRLAITKHNDNDESKTVSVYINCNSTGAEFIHAVADVTVADILDPAQVPHVVDNFFPLNGVASHEGQSHPLLSVQVTELLDGIFLGCSMNHCVCDNTSFWHFLNSWSEISRGLDDISRPPSLKRWFLKNSDCPIHIPLTTFECLTEPHIHSPPPVERFFHVKPESIARLKAMANSEITKNTDSTISSLQALLAHIWVAVTRARCSDPNEKTTFLLVVGDRARLNPPLPELYFGNAIHPRVATTKVGVLLERGFTWGALLLNQLVASHDDAAIRSSLESWVEKPESPLFNLAAVGSPRFNMYGNDFSRGRPVAVRSGPSSRYDGKIRVIPATVEGSMEVEICLPQEILKIMEDDVEFMQVVTVLSHSCGV